MCTVVYGATIVEWSAARVLYRVSACAERLRAGSKPGNEYELFLVSRRELALIDNFSCVTPDRVTSVSQSGPPRPPGGVEEMQGGGNRVRLEWEAYITV
ncbi:hypothetical protein FHG87_016041 [Trinorchestia longiramus]|nr:hypothetical protein FHG87_016041 [Trinorchestia longiramus]